MVLDQRNVRRNPEEHWVRTREILEVRETVGPREREAYEVRAIGLSDRIRRRNDTKVLSNL